MKQNNVELIDAPSKDDESLEKKISFQTKKGNRSSKALANLLNNDNSPFDINQIKKRGNSRYYSKKIMNRIITEDTLVYDILFEQSTDENNIRNYEKVSEEIKKIEQKNEVEKSRLKRKITLISHRLDGSYNKNINKDKVKNENKLLEIEINLRSKTLEMNELEKNKKINIIDLIQKLKIHPEQRTIRDVLRIKPFIENSNLAKSFREEFSDIKLVEKLIIFCSIEMYYKRYKEGQIIYKIGETPSDFYSIIFGKVNLMKAISEEKNMSGLEYFYYLMNLKKREELYLLHKTIEINSNNYQINENHIDIINYVYLYNYLENIKNKEYTNTTFTNLLELLQINPEELGIDISQINSTNYLMSCAKLIKKKLSNISQQIITKYSFLDDDLIKKNVTIFKDEIYQNLKTNDYFGDDAIKETHSLTAISDDITEVAALPIKLYYSEIATLKLMALEKKITNLHTSHFFSNIKYYKFREKYFKLFTHEKYYKGDILFKEGENIKYIYFIKEGSVQLYTSKSINDIESLLTILIQKKETIKLNTNNDSKEDTDDNLNYSKINSTYDDLINFLEIKQKHKLLFLSNNEEIGLVSDFLGSDYLTSCVVVSNEANIYKIDMKYINQMLNEEIDCVEDYNIRIQSKLNLLIQRLFKTNNIKLIMINEKINLEKNKEKNIDEKNKLLINSSKIKGLVNYNQLNYILTEKPNIIQNQKNNLRDILTLPKLSKSIKSPEKYNKEISKDNTQNKNSIFTRPFFSLSKEENKNVKINKSLDKSRNNIFKLLNQNMRYNSGNINKPSKIKLYKNKPNGLNHKILEKLFIPPLSNNNTDATISQVKSKNNIRLNTLSHDYNTRKKNNLFNYKIHLETEIDKSHNHPYYEPIMLVKKNKYKIFETNSKNKKIQNENLKLQNLRLKQIQNIHSLGKNAEDIKEIDSLENFVL